MIIVEKIESSHMLTISSIYLWTEFEFGVIAEVDTWLIGRVCEKHEKNCRTVHKGCGCGQSERKRVYNGK